jgi:hypothetical protein
MAFCNRFGVWYCAVLAVGDTLGIIHILNRQDAIHGWEIPCFLSN